MALLTASRLGIHAGGNPLFDEVSFKLDAGERMTLSGRNGAGKSTLLRLLAGELTPESGKLVLRRNSRVALHDQRPPRDSALALGEYVYSSRTEMIEAEAELARLETQMSEKPGDEETLRAYAETQAAFEHRGGYRWREAVQAVLNGLGFKPDQIERPLTSFSGGELTRASLARALATRPDLLLLDEPTNHLDIPTLEWLESYLVGLDAAVVLVAHDRWFLEAVGTSVLELEAGRGRYFKGPWHAWRKEQAARQIALGRSIERQEAEIARMERFVERFRAKATKARQAQSRVKMIEKRKANAAREAPRDDRKLRFSFEPPERTGRSVLKVEGLELEVPGRTLLADGRLQLEREEHVVLVGPNGAGKTTLIEALAGRSEPAAGKVGLGHNVLVGYLSQHADTAAGEGTVLDALQRETGLNNKKARTLLGGFLFSGDDVKKSLSAISGGEQRRLSLAILVASGANFLILDEPTNHLDIESREALEDALLEFKGAVLLVSHDRALLEAVGQRTLALEDGELSSHLLRWADYQASRDAEKKAARQPAKPSPEKGKRARPKGPSKNALRNVKRIEAEIEKAEAALRALEDELADPGAWASPTSSERASKRHGDAARAVEELYAELERAESAIAERAPG